ncbi:MAG: glycosyltransferase family 2 protein [bacterium]|nr:glycosyltransferase family 2 protein [bacterium]
MSSGDPGAVRPPLVYTILLDYDGLADTLECLSSLRALDYPRNVVVVVDNGARRSCIPEVAARFPQARTMRLERNAGFMGGCNAGMRVALREGADYVWLLNNDTTVEPGALSALVGEAERDARCGIAGSKIFFHDRPSILQHAGAGLDMRDGRFFHIGYGVRDEGQFDEVREVYYVTGCSLLARAATIREIGLMDEDYVFYFDDMDWCVRARRRGWRVKYVPGSVVYHKVSAVTKGATDPSYVYYYSRNYLLFFGKHYPRLFPRALLSWWPRDFVLRFIRERRYDYLAAACRGLGSMMLAASRQALGRGFRTAVDG